MYICYSLRKEGRKEGGKEGRSRWVEDGGVAFAWRDVAKEMRIWDLGRSN